MLEMYDVGDTRRAHGVWTDAETGLPVTPTRVKFFLKSEAGENSYELGVDAEVVQDGANSAYFDMHLDVAGPWSRRWVIYDINDNAVEASETRFRVRETAFSPAT